ncbi:hypothetical protein RRG08_001822 [Elysia crispata]|uniref:Uncharacterized protein n=1 Tax=Elysia crispata TaxID=231223 RepID=A0AAE0Y7X7_9GAST|nr:hypothetical protein RRG08_001822 [Elysia crispata]
MRTTYTHRPNAVLPVPCIELIAILYAHYIHTSTRNHLGLSPCMTAVVRTVYISYRRGTVSHTASKHTQESNIHGRPILWDISLESYKSRTEVTAEWRQLWVKLNLEFESKKEDSKTKYARSSIEEKIYTVPKTKIRTKFEKPNVFSICVFVSNPRAINLNLSEEKESKAQSGMWTNIRDYHIKYLKKLTQETTTGSKAKSSGVLSLLQNIQRSRSRERPHGLQLTMIDTTKVSLLLLTSHRITIVRLSVDALHRTPIMAAILNRRSSGWTYQPHICHSMARCSFCLVLILDLALPIPPTYNSAQPQKPFHTSTICNNKVTILDFSKS